MLYRTEYVNLHLRLRGSYAHDALKYCNARIDYRDTPIMESLNDREATILYVGSSRGKTARRKLSILQTLRAPARSSPADVLELWNMASTPIICKTLSKLSYSEYQKQS